MALERIPAVLKLAERAQRSNSETGTGFASREAVRGPFLPSRCSRRQGDRIARFAIDMDGG
jgi:hypothetical protein